MSITVDGKNNISGLFTEMRCVNLSVFGAGVDGGASTHLTKPDGYLMRKKVLETVSSVA